MSRLSFVWSRWSWFKSAPCGDEARVAATVAALFGLVTAGCVPSLPLVTSSLGAWPVNSTGMLLLTVERVMKRNGSEKSFVTTPRLGRWQLG